MGNEHFKAMSMTDKEKMLKSVQELPDDATYEDGMEKLFFLSKIERGLEQADQGKTLTNNIVRERLHKWLK